MTPDRLDAAEIKRRIEAARVLRGIGQADLDRLFHKDGLGKGEAGRTERGDLPMTRVRREAFCRHLGVPERWFTAASIDEIVGLHDTDKAASLEERLDRIEQLIGTNTAGISDLIATADAIQRGERPVPQPQGELGRRLAAQRTSDEDPEQPQTPPAEDQQRGLGG